MGVVPFITGVVVGGVAGIITAISSFNAEWDCKKYGFGGEAPNRYEHCIQLERKD